MHWCNAPCEGGVPGPGRTVDRRSRHAGGGHGCEWRGRRVAKENVKREHFSNNQRTPFSFSHSTPRDRAFVKHVLRRWHPVWDAGWNAGRNAGRPRPRWAVQGGAFKHPSVGHVDRVLERLLRSLRACGSAAPARSRVAARIGFSPPPGSARAQPPRRLVRPVSNSHPGFCRRVPPEAEHSPTPLSSPFLLPPLPRRPTLRASTRPSASPRTPTRRRSRRRTARRRCSTTPTRAGARRPSRR
jgi:hypothetical protein